MYKSWAVDIVFKVLIIIVSPLFMKQKQHSLFSKKITTFAKVDLLKQNMDI